MNTKKNKKKTNKKTETKSIKEVVKKSKNTSTSTSNRSSNSGSNLVLNMSIGLIAIIVGYLFCSFPQEGYSLGSGSIEVSSNGHVVDHNHGDDVKTVQCTNETLSQFLHDDFVQGMHLICFHSKKETDEKLMEMIFYPGMIESSKQQRNVVSSSIFSWDTLESMLVKQLELPSYKESKDMNKQPWAIYTSTGQHIYTTSASTINEDSKEILKTTVLKNGMVLLMEGGAWVWPGVREGFQRQVHLHDTKMTILLETLSLRPLLFSVQHFISEKECDEVQRISKPHVRSASGVSLMDQDQGKDASEWRTSQSAFIASQRKGDALDLLEHRTSSLTRLPISHQEYTQVLRYGKGQKYDSHHDYFNKEYYAKDPGTLDLIQHGKRNRLATVFWYLSGKYSTLIVPQFNQQSFQLTCSDLNMLIF